MIRNRQPKFRGFSLAKASDKDQQNGGEDSTAEEGATETVVTATTTRTEVRTTEVHLSTTNGHRTTTLSQGVPVGKSDGATAGLSDHFQGRIQARLRGTG